MTALGKFNLVLIVIIAFAAGEVIGNRGAIHGYGQHYAEQGSR